MAYQRLKDFISTALKRVFRSANPVVLQPGRHVLVLKHATEPRAFIPEECWTSETVTATWVEAEIVESDVSSLVGETTTGFVWGTAARKIVTGDRVEVETYNKKMLRGSVLRMTKVR